MATNKHPPLREQPFIEEIQTYNDPEDLAYGESIERECGSCFYRNYPDNPDGDCHLADPKAKVLFGFKPEEFLPEELEGKQVGNYCPYFTNMNAE